jgi:uncharacterized protein YbjT (DUF2867 family)
MAIDQRSVLVTGATGYVGGRLAPRLLAAGYRVRAAGRSLDKLACRPWAGHPNLELVKGDVQDPAGLFRALKGCRAAYYLVHSMNPQTVDYQAADRRAALNMAAAAEAAGLERIIYLGGITPDDPRLSKHLRSRAEVAQILMAGRTPVTWLRAAMLLGSGSASFELMRYLVDRLPVMITPRWVRTPCQPIAVENALAYLEGCLDRPEVLGRGFDIGGPEVLTYEQLFRTYAQEAGLARRLIIPVPWLSPKLSALWINLVTPLPAALARPLAEGLRNQVVVRDPAIQEIIPQRLMPCREAIRRALERIAQEQVETCWSDAGNPLPPEWVNCGDAPYAGGTILKSGYRATVRARPEDLWPGLQTLGGKGGYHFGNWAWHLRGFMDKLAGGVGTSRGRRHPRELQVGDALDFWRVLQIEAPHRLLLLAEMKTPGEALLELRLDPKGPDHTELSMIARFLPRGLAGIVYWQLHYLPHIWLYRGMLHGLARHAGQPLDSPPKAFTPSNGTVCRLR